MSRSRTGLSLRAWVRIAGPWLDVRLAVGEDPTGNAALARRSADLVSVRSRRGLARGLERALRERPGSRPLSAAVSCDRRAMEIARPALEQLARALRERDSVGPQGVALVRVLLTEPRSALYAPAYPEQLYQAAREALFSLQLAEPVDAGDRVLV